MTIIDLSPQLAAADRRAERDRQRAAAEKERREAARQARVAAETERRKTEARQWAERREAEARMRAAAEAAEKERRRQENLSEFLDGFTHAVTKYADNISKPTRPKLEFIQAYANWLVRQDDSSFQVDKNFEHIARGLLGKFAFGLALAKIRYKKPVHGVTLNGAQTADFDRLLEEKEADVRRMLERRTAYSTTTPRA